MRTPWATVAAAVRAELKVTRDSLGIPASATIKVTSGGFSGGADVTVDIANAESWAWHTATESDDLVIKGYHRAGSLILSDASRLTGDKVCEVIRKHRDAADAGDVWGECTYGGGTTLGTLSQKRFVPGQD